MAPGNFHLLLTFTGLTFTGVFRMYCDVQLQLGQKMALFLMYNKMRGGELTCFLSKASCMSSLTQEI